MPNLQICFTIPIILIQLGIMGMGIGIIVSSLTTKYRDLSVLVTFGIQLWMYITPVVYPLSQAGIGKLRYILLINPVTTPIELFRCGILGKGEVEIVQKAVDFITDFNAQCKKPVITPRNRFFQLPEMARQARLKLQEIRERENRELKFEGGTLVWNYEADRLQILFDSIPDDQRRKELKSYGFKWSPRYQAWQRQLTQNAVYAVKRVLNLQNL